METFELIQPIAWKWISNNTRMCIIKMDDYFGGWVEWYWDNESHRSPIFKSQIRKEISPAREQLYFRDETHNYGCVFHLDELIYILALKRT